MSILPAWRSNDAPGQAPELVEADEAACTLLADLESRCLLRGVPDGLAHPGALVALPDGQQGEVCGWLDRSDTSSRLASERIALVEVSSDADANADPLEQRLFLESEIRVLREWPSETFLRRWAMRLQPKETVQ